jgi:tetratricopeptide (TPR) repeat protein
MRTLALALLVLVSFQLGSARAQTSGGNDEGTANQLIEQAARAYDQNQLDQALQLLSRAYALSPRASILYNQAQVLRTKDDCSGALDAYKRFIDTTAPDDPNRERALRRRDEMQACVDQRNPPPAPAKLAPPERAPPAATPPAVVLSVPATSGNTDDDPARDRRAMRTGGWALIGVGVVAAGAAAVFAWKAHNIQDQIDAELSQSNVWSPEQNSRYGAMNNDALVSYLCAGVAALAAGGGATLLIVSRPPAAAGGETHAALIGWSSRF